MRRIRFLSTLAMLIMAPMLIAYPYYELGWVLDLAFLDPDRWTRNSAWVDADAVIATQTRIVFFLVWAVPFLIGTISYGVAFFTLWLVRDGRFFEPVVARNLTWVGVLMTLSSGGAILAGCVSPMIRSWHNAGGPLPLRFWYSSGNLGLIYCGFAFIFIGLVMREAIRIAQENKEFI